MTCGDVKIRCFSMSFCKVCTFRNVLLQRRVFWLLQRNYTPGKERKNWASEDVLINPKTQNVRYAKRNSSILKGLEYINLFAVKTILNMQQPKSANMLRLSKSRVKAESVVEKVQSVVNYIVETVAVGDQGKEVKDKKKATRRSNVCKKSTLLSSKLKLSIKCNPMYLRTKSHRNMESVSHSSQNG